jgi:hypothetical protein
MKKAALFIISIFIMITIIFSTASRCDPYSKEIDDRKQELWQFYEKHPERIEEYYMQYPEDRPAEEQAKEESKTGEDAKEEQNPESESPESLEASVPTTFIGTEMPKNWPEDIPVKSGIKIKSTQEQGSGKGYVAGIAGTYFGDPMGLYDFYKNALSSYNLTETKVKADDGSESITLIGEKDGAEVTVMIQYKGDEVILVAIGYKIK